MANVLRFARTGLVVSLVGLLAACARVNPDVAPHGYLSHHPGVTDPEVITVGGQKVAVHHFGDPNGFPMFFFHGWPSDASQGILLDAAAKRHGLRVLAPDRPGIGMSERQPGRRLADWPPLVHKIAEHYHIHKFAVLGVSGGGPYALATAHALPDEVSAVAIVCGAPPLAEETDTKELLPIYRVLLHTYRESPNFLRDVFLAGRPIVRKMPDSFWRVMVRSLPEPDREALADPATFAAVFGGLRRSWISDRDGVHDDATIYAQPWGFSPEQIRVPVEFWHGAEDRNFQPPLARKLANRIPGARFYLVEHEGHYSLPVRRTYDILDHLKAAGMPKAVAIPEVE